MKVITVEHETDTAHRLSCHKGKCANLHGHRYKFVVSIDAAGTIEEKGFVDFYELKKAVRELLDDLLDHRTVLKNCSENAELIELLMRMENKIVLMDLEPTVEAMVGWLCVKLDGLPGLEGCLRQLTIYETPTNYCTWIKERSCGCRRIQE